MPGPALSESQYTITTQNDTIKSPSGYPIVGFEDFTGQDPGTTYTVVKVNGDLPSTGLLYVTIHLEYGLKGTGGWTKVADGSGYDAVNEHITGSGTYSPTGGATVKIDDPETYPFGFTELNSGIGDDEYQNSYNAFKKSVGTAGNVLKLSTQLPAVGTQVVLTNSSGKTVTTAITDEDGAYWLNYKHTGKAATFYVKLPSYNKSVKITLKANGFVISELPGLGLHDLNAEGVGPAGRPLRLVLVRRLRRRPGTRSRPRRAGYVCSARRRRRRCTRRHPPAMKRNRV